jgi:hypothetical protein
MSGKGSGSGGVSAPSPQSPASLRGQASPTQPPTRAPCGPRECSTAVRNMVRALRCLPRVRYVVPDVPVSARLLSTLNDEVGGHVRASGPWEWLSIGRGRPLQQAVTAYQTPACAWEAHLCSPVPLPAHRRTKMAPWPLERQRTHGECAGMSGGCLPRLAPVRPRRWLRVRATRWCHRATARLQCIPCVSRAPGTGRRQRMGPLGHLDGTPSPCPARSQGGPGWRLGTSRLRTMAMEGVCGAAPGPLRRAVSPQRPRTTCPYPPPSSEHWALSSRCMCAGCVCMCVW